MTQLRQKLNRTSGLITKLRHQVSSSLVKTIYFALFDSHFSLWSTGMESKKQQYSGHDKENTK